MYSSKELREKAKLRDDVKKLKESLADIENKINSILHKIKNKCSDFLKKRTSREFEEFCKDKELPYSIERAQTQASDGIIRLGISEENTFGGPFIDLTIDEKPYKVKTSIKTPEFCHTPGVKSYPIYNKEVATLREEKNSLEDKLQSQKKMLNFLKDLSESTCDKLPVEFTLSTQHTPNSFGSFKKLLEEMIK